MTTHKALNREMTKLTICHEKKKEYSPVLSITLMQQFRDSKNTHTKTKKKKHKKKNE